MKLFELLDMQYSYWIRVSSSTTVVIFMSFSASITSFSRYEQANFDDTKSFERRVFDTRIIRIANNVLVHHNVGSLPRLIYLQ